MNGFHHREVPPSRAAALPPRPFRLFGLDEAGCREALERLHTSSGLLDEGVGPPPSDALARDRGRYWSPPAPARVFPRCRPPWAETAAADASRRFHRRLPALLLGKSPRSPPAVREEMNRSGGGEGPRAGGLDHDRPRAGSWAEESILDLLMIRYKRRAPRAEEEIFPAPCRRRPAVVAYTRTAWRKLLRAPGG